MQDSFKVNTFVWRISMCMFGSIKSDAKYSGISVALFVPKLGKMFSIACCCCCVSMGDNVGLQAVSVIGNAHT